MDLKHNRQAARGTDDLLRLAMDGDQEALGRLFTRHMTRLYRIALRLLRSPQDAEDALQDGLLSASFNLRRFEGRSQFSTWLSRIVINAALMRLRKERAHVATSIDQEYVDQENLALADTIPDRGPNPEEAYRQKELSQIVEQKAQALPAGLRSAFRLRYIEGLDTAEAAEALGLTAGALKSQLHRARLKISGHVRKAVGPRTTPSHLAMAPMLEQTTRS